MFNSFFNRTLAYNANNCHTDIPADIKVADDIAVDTLTSWGYSTVPPARGDLFSMDGFYASVDSGREGRNLDQGRGDRPGTWRSGQREWRWSRTGQRTELVW